MIGFMPPAHPQKLGDWGCHATLLCGGSQHAVQVDVAGAAAQASAPLQTARQANRRRPHQRQPANLGESHTSSTPRKDISCIVSLPAAAVTLKDEPCKYLRCLAVNL